MDQPPPPALAAAGAFLGFGSGLGGAAPDAINFPKAEEGAEGFVDVVCVVGFLGIGVDLVVMTSTISSSSSAADVSIGVGSGDSPAKMASNAFSMPVVV